ncbi:ATP-dependent zinc metalloprotease FtsH [Mahella australiensis]|uniref:ATP-dependent zinc metalloprotease FtsH n=1 Tax=Mahella australiensis (strain DSM 15567 / CIP 107919 / 50-1 BON) TaxID=697281 RepID=F3ZW93_MAHA5|nr:ATP-dependent zinc metalloprotease FtsH [Mahella australiensis]AEE97502.1 ATP-dependent metalloprotease FtsH [Mahella australiensis 50-1 BON]
MKRVRYIKNKRVLAILLVIVIAAAAIALFYNYNSRPQPREMTYGQFLDSAKAGKVDKIYLSNDARISGNLKDGTPFITDNPRTEGFKEQMLLYNVKVEEKQATAWGNIIMFGMLGGLLIAAFFAIRGPQAQAQNGLNTVSPVKPKDEDISVVKFDSVAGNQEAKESLAELVDFIKEPEKYAKYGARIPRGVILYGPPGTGKTLLARALAGEAGVPFYAVSGSDFVQMYVGVGAARIRSLFKKAREQGKCVIFIDEIDALGKKRNGGRMDGGSDERDQTLNALLAEMSGFNENQGIVIMAATNRLDVLDEALLRPGRFDRQIEVGLPDVNGRHKILKLHSGNKPIAPEVDLWKVAQQTVYFSGAQLESMLNEAAIIAAKRDAESIEMSDIDKAFYTVIAGAEKTDRSAISEIDRKITAYHEAGHALVTKLIAPENRVSKVTIIPSTRGAGGFSMNIPPDRMYQRKADMENQIRIAMAGRAAEELVFGEDNITTGASNDIEQATNIVLALVKRFGMSAKGGLLNYDVLYNNSLQSIGAELVDECKRLMDGFYKDVCNLLGEHRFTLDHLAHALLQKETLGEEEIDAIVKGKATALSC